MAACVDLEYAEALHGAALADLGWAFPGGPALSGGALERPVVTSTGDAGFGYYTSLRSKRAARWKINAVTVVAINNAGAATSRSAGFDRARGGDGWGRRWEPGT